MRHSLLSRFQGTLLGAALGEILGANCYGKFYGKLYDKSSLSWLTVAQWGFDRFDQAPAVSWGKIAAAQARDLIQRETSSTQVAIAGTPKQEFSADQALLIAATSNPLAGAGLAIALLPLMLFCHEDLGKWQFALQEAIARWQISPPSLLPTTDALVIGYTVALALREQLEPDNLIPQIVADLQLNEVDPLLVQQLNQVQTWVTQGVGVAIARQFSKTAILGNNRAESEIKGSDLHPKSSEAASTAPAFQRASSSFPLSPLDSMPLALYSFLSTPEDFRLSLLRAAQSQHHPQLTCALTGILSGSYNGMAGLPPNWCHRLNYSSSSFLPQATSPLSVLWDVSSNTQIFQLASQLLAVWSGVYTPADWLKPFYTPMAVTAAPHVIRHR